MKYTYCKLKVIYGLIALVLFSCDPTNPTPSTNYKIRNLMVVSNGDSANYTFTYSGNNLRNVTRDGIPYAEVAQASGIAYVMMNYNFYKDTFVIHYNGNNFIDSMRHLNGINYRKYYRNGTNQIDSCRYTETGTSLFYKNYSYIVPLTYNHSNVYTCGLYNTCTQTNIDTVLFSGYTIQSNLPEQFTSFPVSEGFSLLDLNPMFLVQQNGIYIYQPHRYLIYNLHTSYSILVSQYPPKRIHFRYDYRFDSQNRVSLIYQYDDLISISTPFKTFAITYFD